jgi:hypothetical protein
LERLFAALDEPRHLKIIDGADHFFEGHLTELAQSVSQFIEQQGESERGIVNAKPVRFGSELGVEESISSAVTCAFGY